MNYNFLNFSWFWIAFLGYFLVALEVVLDKFLLSSKKVSHPAVYAFYSAVLSLFVVVFWLTGQVHKVTLDFFALSLLCGAVFVYGIFCLFFALRSGEAGRAIPVSGAVMPVIVALLSLFFLQERLNTFHWLGIFLLILGGLLISLEKNKKSNFFAEAKYAVLAGVLLAISSVIFKYLSIGQPFLHTFFWTRLGLFAGALTFLIVPNWRKSIGQSLKIKNRNSKNQNRTQGLFVFNKILGGVGSIFNNFAISLGSAALVTALVAVEYVFIFVLSVIFAYYFPQFFRERFNRFQLVQKMLAVFIIAYGVFLLVK